MGIASNSLKKVLQKFLPDYLIDQVIFELGLAKVNRSKNKILNQFKGQKNLKVNVGCGESGKPGWTNIDGFHTVNVAARWDCRTSLPFENESADAIFTEHFFEHIDYDAEAPLLLKDFYRVLKKGGTVRIIVPDAEKFARGYVSEGWAELTATRPLEEGNIDAYSKYKYKTKMELVNHIFRQHYQHKYAYDFDTLKMLLQEAGFNNIVKSGFNSSKFPVFNIDMEVRRHESLYVDAQK